MAKVKVISLKQPWAYLFAIGAKKFETRGWQPRYHTSGELFIHASGKIISLTWSFAVRASSSKNIFQIRQAEF
jgi:hypothetical protein